MSSFYFLSSTACCFDVAWPANQFQGGGPYKVSTYIQDYTSPTVQSFDLDMNAGRLVISLDEPVNPSTVYLPGIAIQRYNFTGKEAKWKYSLTRSSELSTVSYSDTAVIALGKEDLDNIKVSQMMG